MVAAVLASLILGAKIEPDFSGAWDYAKVRGANAVVVMIDGKVVYQVGEVDNRKQLLASGTKSLTGTAMACAIQDKLLPGGTRSWKWPFRNGRMTIEAILLIDSFWD